MTTGARAMIGIVVVSCAFLLVSARSEAALAQPLFTGIAGLDTYEPAALEQVGASGATLVHIAVPWASVAPRKQPDDWSPADPADPNYRWASTDYAVMAAVDAGLTPVLLVDGAPLWAQRCQVPPPATGGLCNPDPTQLAAFASAAATRYSGTFDGLPRVRYWQGLNEPNLSLFFNPQYENGHPVSATLYRALINSFYFAIKSVNQSNLVIAAGLGPVEVRPWTIGPMRFTRELLCMVGRNDPHAKAGDCEGGVHFDIFDIHPYTTGGPTHEGHVDDVELGSLAKLQELISAANRAGRIKGRFRHTPLWITEFSWDSKPPDPGGLAMPILKRWTAEALYRAWSAGVSHFFWFGLRDFPENPAVPFSETIQSGLFFRGATVAEDRPKPNLQAFRFPFVAYTSKTGFTYWGRTPTSEAGGVKIQVREHGHWRKAGVARAAGDGIFQGAVTTPYGRGKRGMVRALYRKEVAIPFSLHPVRDFHQAPLGNPVG